MSVFIDISETFKVIYQHFKKLSSEHLNQFFAVLINQCEPHSLKIMFISVIPVCTVLST